MNLVQRVQDILLRPQATWPQIDAEAATPGSLYKGYLLILAAIPAVCGFIGLAVLGMGLRLPMGWALGNMVVSYLLSLLMVGLLALAAEALAPHFGGRKDRVAAFKLLAFASTAAFVGGVFALLPMLAVLSLVASLYSVYLLYTGAPVLMKVPGDKAVAYTAVLVVCGIVGGLVLGAVAGIGHPGTVAMR